MIEKDLVNKQSCLKAYQKVKKILKPTPLVFSERYSSLTKKEVYLKLDSKLSTGSFKERGALNFLLNLDAKQKKQGICAASAGNHALALSYHTRKLGLSCNIVMPVHAPLVKVRACQEQGANVLSMGETFTEAATIAKALCEEKGYIYAPAFDHTDVVNGQASCGLEILKQLPDLDSVIVPVGGGGLISGISTVMKSFRKKAYILGVQSKWAYDAQRTKHSATTALRSISIADGIAIKRIGQITKPIIEKNVDNLISVSESNIAEGLIEFLQLEKSLIEGAAAAAIAGLHAGGLPKRCKKIVVVISGSNIDTNLLLRLIERDMAEHEKVFRMRLSIPDRPGSLNALTTILAENGVNILQVQHDRSFSKVPGNVEVTLLLEFKDAKHKNALTKVVRKLGIKLSEI